MRSIDMYLSVNLWYGWGRSFKSQHQYSKKQSSEGNGQKERKVMIHRTPTSTAMFVGLQCHYKLPTVLIIIIQTLENYQKK